MKCKKIYKLLKISIIVTVDEIWAADFGIYTSGTQPKYWFFCKKETTVLIRYGFFKKDTRPCYWFLGIIHQTHSCLISVFVVKQCLLKDGCSFFVKEPMVSKYVLVDCCASEISS